MSLCPASLSSVLCCCSLFPSFLPSGRRVGEELGDLKLCTKDTWRKTLQNHLKCFPLSLFWEMSSTPKKHFQKKHKVADYSQTMPPAPSSSSKSWYCCRGYLRNFFLCAPPELVFISAPCWGLVRKWGQGFCHFGPRSAHKGKKKLIVVWKWLKLSWKTCCVFRVLERIRRDLQHVAGGEGSLCVSRVFFFDLTCTFVNYWMNFSKQALDSIETMFSVTIPERMIQISNLWCFSVTHTSRRDSQVSHNMEAH